MQGSECKEVNTNQIKLFVSGPFNSSVILYMYIHNAKECGEREQTIRVSMCILLGSVDVFSTCMSFYHML